jgi:hypothetical protein
VLDCQISFWPGLQVFDGGPKMVTAEVAFVLHFLHIWGSSREESPTRLVLLLVVRVLGYRSGGPGSIPGTNRKKSSVSATGTTQPREHN